MSSLSADEHLTDDTVNKKRKRRRPYRKKMSIRMHSDRAWVLNTDSILYNSIVVPLRYLQAYGMYPVNNLPKWSYYCYAGLVHCTLTLPAPLLTFTYLFVNRHILDLVTVIDLLFMIMEIAITIPKYTPIRLYPERVRHTVEWLTRKEFTAYHPDQEKIAIETSELFKKVFYYFLAACVITWVAVVFKPFFMGQKKLLTEIWLPFDPTQNDYIFIAVSVLLAIGMSNAALGNCSLDSIIVGLIFHATGQLKIIKGTLQDVIKHSKERVSFEYGNLHATEFELLKNRHIYQEICKCVDRYALIKEFIKDIEDTYSFSILSQFAASIVVIGFACIQFTLVGVGSVGFYVTLIWLTTMIWEVFLFCYFGSLLYFESLTFVTDIYLTNWLDLDKKSQKAYLIIMESAKQPLMVRAGKVIDLSLDTFATIMRRSYSLLTLCNKLL